ncbi:hypothetical protein DL769_000661 [Monosporascus sp. CRB-8-3]|nr:hypothetical protein DL769_000661 [Monosporascus sp. CRB-8-3]
MPLCDLCIALDLVAVCNSKLPPGVGLVKCFPAGLDLYEYNVDGIDDVTEKLAPFHKSLDALQASADRCELCRLVHRCVEQALANRSEAVKRDFIGYVLTGFEFWLTGLLLGDGFQIIGVCEGDRERRELHLMGSIAFCAEEGSPLSTKFRLRPIPPSPVSANAVNQWTSWIKDCDSECWHDQPQSTSRPTRLLEIKGDDVILRAGKDTTGDYACLSHCWGLSRPTVLMTQTFEALSNGVKTGMLPQTFQDAVFVVRQLGIRYLWIDSLCILQDDRADWAKESARMCDVYKNAFVTIAANRASGCTEGFLGDRMPLGYAPVSLPDSEILAYALPLKIAIESQWVSRMEDEPLAARGWALQERYLSPRLLHFNHTQTIFECDTEVRAEEGSRCRGKPFRLNDVSNHQGDWMWSRAWTDIVCVYSRRKLTYADDKLPAVAGLASHFSLDTVSSISVSDGQRVSGNRYLAGLWFDSLIQDLCWELDAHSEPAVRPSTYRAPWWSWASLDAAVNYHFPTSSNPHSLLAIVKDASVQLKSPENPYGEVTGAWIHLRARRLRLYTQLDSYHILWFSQNGREYYISGDWDPDSYMGPKEDKAPDLAKGETELFAIPLTWQIPRPDQGQNSLIGPFFLILKPSVLDNAAPSGLPTFERVGSGILTGPSAARDEVQEMIEGVFLAAKVKDNLEDIILV